MSIPSMPYSGLVWHAFTAWPRCRTGTTGEEKRIVYIFPGTERVEEGEEGENVSAPPPLSVWQCVQVKGDTKEEGRENREEGGWRKREDPSLDRRASCQRQR